MKDDKTEYILCSAIWYKDFHTLYRPVNLDKGVVLCGHRHTNIIHQHVSLLGKRAAEMGAYVQGFLTSKNRFLDRGEAAKLAFEAGQISQPKNELFSEDLY